MASSLMRKLLGEQPEEKKVNFEPEPNKEFFMGKTSPKVETEVGSSDASQEERKQTQTDA